MRLFKLAFVGFACACKGPFFIAKKLSFKQRFGNRGAIH